MSKEVPMKKKPLYKHLYVQVLFAIACGVLLGHFYPDTGSLMEPLGDGFIKLIKMIIAPIIFCTVVTGIAGMEDMKKVGRVGGKALLYFEAVSTIALIIGLVVVNTLKPGVGMNVDIAALDTKALASYTTAAHSQSTVDFLLNVIPSTVIDAFAKGEILQVLLFSLLFGFALSSAGETGRPVVTFIDKVAHALFIVVGFIMRLAPSGHSARWPSPSASTASARCSSSRSSWAAFISPALCSSLSFSALSPAGPGFP